MNFLQKKLVAPPAGLTCRKSCTWNPRFGILFPMRKSFVTHAAELIPVVGDEMITVNVTHRNEQMFIANKHRME